MIIKKAFQYTKLWKTLTPLVIPAQAGIYTFWIPACAGMTER